MSATKCFYIVSNEKVNRPDRYDPDNIYTVSAHKFAVTKSQEGIILQMLQDIHFNIIGKKDTEIDIYLVSVINTGNGEKNKLSILNYFNKQRSKKYNVDILFNINGVLNTTNSHDIKPLSMNPYTESNIRNKIAQNEVLSNELNEINMLFNVYEYENNQIYICNPNTTISIALLKEMIGNFNIQ